MSSIPPTDPVSVAILRQHDQSVLTSLLGPAEVCRRVNAIAIRYNHAVPSPPEAFYAQIQSWYRHGLIGPSVPPIPNAIAFWATAPKGPVEPSRFAHKYLSHDDQKYYILDVKANNPSLIVPLAPYHAYAHVPGRATTVLDSIENVPYWVVGTGGLGVSVAGQESYMVHHGDMIFTNTKGEVQTQVSVKIQWPGYAMWEGQIRMKNVGNGSGDSFTFSRLVNQVRSKVRKFIKDHAGTTTRDPHWAVGTTHGHISTNDLILLGIVVVSAGSVIPILKLREDFDDFEFGDRYNALASAAGSSSSSRLDRTDNSDRIHGDRSNIIRLEPQSLELLASRGGGNVEEGGTEWYLSSVGHQGETGLGNAGRVEGVRMPAVSGNREHDARSQVPLHPSPGSSSEPWSFTPPTEVTHYYYGLPSQPLLLARTSTIEWKEPAGPEAYLRPKKICPVGSHAALQSLWEDKIALKVIALLSHHMVEWTSLDVVRIGYVGESLGPVILWIGVASESLANGHDVASQCLQILNEHGIHDVEVEIRRSVVGHMADLQLLPSSPYTSDATHIIRNPLTATLGSEICPVSFPYTKGTGGLLVFEGEEGKRRLLLLTARHVVFPPAEDSQVYRQNQVYKYDPDSSGAPRYDVWLMGLGGFSQYQDKIREAITNAETNVQIYRDSLGVARKKNDRDSQRERVQKEFLLKQEEDSVSDLRAYQQTVENWRMEEDRILGNVILSPPIAFGVGDEGMGWTEDWAVIEINATKIDPENLNFNGNAIDLGDSDIERNDLVEMLDSCASSSDKFEYPPDRLLRLQGYSSDGRLQGNIPDAEIRSPLRDDEGDQHLVVLKHGAATRLTVGLANTIPSIIRNYEYEVGDKEKEKRTSKEWCILPLNTDDKECYRRPFSQPGDSGSAVVDRSGRVGGIITGGQPQVNGDITYATPISFIFKRMEALGLKNPCIATLRPYGHDHESGSTSESPTSAADQPMDIESWNPLWTVDGRDWTGRGRASGCEVGKGFCGAFA